MQARIPWFKCYPEKLISAICGLKHDEGCVYVMVLLRIYEIGGPISDDANTIARRIDLTERRVECALQSLVIKGKIYLENGMIDSISTHEELEARKLSVIKNKSSGKEGAKNRWQKNQQNQQKPMASAIPLAKGRDSETDGEAMQIKNISSLRSDIESSSLRSEQNIPSSLRSEGAQDAPKAEKPLDAKDRLWKEGVPILISFGNSDRSARPLIGRWMKDAKDNAEMVLGAIVRARDERIIDPVPWITRYLTPKSKTDSKHELKSQWSEALGLGEQNVRFELDLEAVPISGNYD